MVRFVYLVALMAAPIIMVEGGFGYAACVAACSVAVATPTGGVAIVTGTGVAACAAGCLPLTVTCFADDVNVSKIVKDSDGKETTVQAPVQEIQVGDYVLTKNSDGFEAITKVVHNKRTSGRIKHVSVSVQTSTSVKELVVTDNHMMLVANGTDRATMLVQASDLKIGEIVELRESSSRGQIISVVPTHLDHRNELVTAAGTVLANDILVSTVCSEYAKLGDLKTTLARWQRDHTFWTNATNTVDDKSMVV
jgi:hypothetical protein